MYIYVYIVCERNNVLLKTGGQDGEVQRCRREWREGELWVKVQDSHQRLEGAETCVRLKFPSTFYLVLTGHATAIPKQQCASKFMHSPEESCA